MDGLQYAYMKDEENMGIYTIMLGMATIHYIYTISQPLDIFTILSWDHVLVVFDMFFQNLSPIYPITISKYLRLTVENFRRFSTKSDI